MFSPLQAYFTPPSPTGSRWNALTNAVNSFVSVLQSRNIDAHVCLVTFAETYSFGNYTSALYGVSANLFKTTVTDPLGKSQTTWADGGVNGRTAEAAALN